MIRNILSELYCLGRDNKEAGELKEETELKNEDKMKGNYVYRNISERKCTIDKRVSENRMQMQQISSNLISTCIVSKLG